LSKPARPVTAFMAASLLPGVLILLIMWVLPVSGGDGDRQAMAMRGFANMWAAGQAVAGGNTGVLFDQPAYAAFVRGLFGKAFTEQMWGYPPPALLLAVPFAMLPMLAGFMMWTFGTLALFWAAMRRCGMAAGVAAAAIASPAALDGALSGQNGALTATALAGGLLLVGTRPVAAGVLLGLLALKPQLALLIPVCLIAAGYWRAALAAAATAGVLAAASGLCFGWDTWLHFATDTRGFMAAVLAQPWTGAPAQANFTSPFFGARAMGAPLWLAWGVQASASAACAALAWRLWRMRGCDPVMRMAVTVPLALLATPYSHNHDLVVSAAAAAAVGAAALRGRWLPGERVVLGLAWAWPGLSPLLAALVPASAAFAAVTACAGLSGTAWCAWRRLDPGGADRRRSARPRVNELVLAGQGRGGPPTPSRDLVPCSDLLAS